MKRVASTAVVAAAAAAALTLSACSSTASTSAPSATPSPSSVAAAPARVGGGGPPTDRGPGGAGAGPGAGQVTGTSTASPPAGSVAAAVWEALMGPTGEYAAAASYQAVIAAFGPVEPYVSIEAMEQNHISALTRQLARLGVVAPPNPYLGTIAAPADLVAAANAWAEGERKNVALYDGLFSAASSDAGVTRVFTNLRGSSLEAHLPLFEAAAKSSGTLTEAQMLELGFMRH